ncbi:MAG: C4-dicarboxylate ABC transporter [Gammaproteobacteria bacterium RBG_16_57_12]|nr:MAG: C4-dicarboxylate ABC transporter [Gammaproteobacteria bacterium RBG_16_57_12]
MIAGVLWTLGFFSEAGATTFKIATLAPDGTTWMKEMRAGAEEIKQQTNGRVEFRFYPGGVMGNAGNVLRKMRIGQLNGGAFASGEVASVYSGVQIYSLPFLFRSYDEVDYVRQQMDEQLIANMSDKGLVPIGISEGGFAYMMSDKPLLKVVDLKGRRVWIPEGDAISQAMFNAAGISPIPLPIADVYTGLQTGLVDTVANSTTGAIAFQWHARMNRVTDAPMLLIIGMLVVDKKALDKISTEDRAVVLKVMTAAFKRLNRLNREDDAKAREALIKQGVTFDKPSENEVMHWREIAKQALARLGAENVYPRDLLEAVQGHLSTYREQSRSSNAQ